jgi:phosphoribosylformylglycinamidine cyclo-ligase
VTTLDYRQAGVNIDAGNALVDRIKPLVASTHNDAVLSGIGGFAALYQLPTGDSQAPILVSATDGVGTKLKLAQDCNQHDTVGIDLVAMCVNDLLCTGARPLFFLDYYATGKLDVDATEQVIRGIVEGCRQASSALIGGETAEMPGMYQNNDYDLAGFAVGMVTPDKLITGEKVSPNDVLIGIASSGAHSNGYSLIRRVLADIPNWQQQQLDGKALAAQLLAPTRIYVDAILSLGAQIDIHACAHITGGGLPENLPRVLTDNCRAIIDTHSWPRPALFEWLQTVGNIESHEMWRTFNCGVGMVVCVANDDKDKAIELLTAAGETAWQIGRIVEHAGSADVVFE